MSVVINTNLASLRAQTNLARTQGGLAAALQRLSSGLRVNSARDDAAGLAISERMTAQLRGTNMAVRNVNDGISLLQTAEHTLGQMTERLQRIRELAVQSLNGTQGTSDRKALDQEVQLALKEMDRTVGSTVFNGRKLLDGSAGSMLFQTGANTDDTVSLDLTVDLHTTELGAIATARSADLRTSNGGSGGGFAFAGTYTTVALGNLDFSRPDVALVPGRAVATTGQSNYSGAQASSFSVDGVTINLNVAYGTLNAVAGAIQGQLNTASNGAYAVSQDGSHLTITKTSRARNASVAPAIAAGSGPGSATFAGAALTNGVAASRNTRAGFSVDGHRVAITANHSGNVAGLIADIQAQLAASTGSANTYSVVGSEAGLSVRRGAGHATPVVDHFTDNGSDYFSQGATSYLTLNTGDFSVQIGTRPAVNITGRFNTADALAREIQARVSGVVAQIDNNDGRLRINAVETVTLGGAQAQAGGSLAFAQLVNNAEGSLADSQVREAKDASTSLLRVDAAINTLHGHRATFGAMLGRFDAVVSSLQQNAEVVSASRGRIVDADFASETAAMTGAQVLRSAGLAMLAQLNVRPQDVMLLLRAGAF
ncbi:MAG: hypothetical protein RLZZ618_2085 [Pseudomonadota bacterium]|jgi:flagellin